MMTARNLLKFPLAVFPLAALLSCSPTRVVQPVLSIVNISPSGGATGVALDVVVSVTFTHPLMTDTITGNAVQLLDSDGDSVEADVTYLSENQAVLVAPTDPLDLASDYVLVLGTVLESSKGAALVTEIRSTFRTTGDAPSNELPIADAGANKTVAVGATVLLDGTGSMDPEGASLDYAWTLQTAPSNSVATISAADAANSSFQADLPGDYLISLVVSDGIDDSSPAYVQITASDDPVDTGDTGDTVDTGDSGEAGTYEGTFSGPILVNVKEEQVLWAEDVCTGTLTLTVSLTVNPPVSGSWSCSFSPNGPFSQFWPTIAGTLDGTFTSTDNIAGTLYVESDSTTWTGQFTSFNSLAGTIPESRVDVDIGGVLLDVGYSGDFTATRQ